MTDLINHIDTRITQCIDLVTAFGLCHLIEDTGGVYPVTVGTESTRVAPNDRSTVLTYHRLLNGQYAPREDLSFGRYPTAQNAQRVRTVVFISLSSDQNLIDDVINALPDDFEIAGYRYCNLSKNIDLIREHDAIWSQEFGDTYKSRFQQRFQIYALEYNLEYIKCSVCDTSP